MSHDFKDQRSGSPYTLCSVSTSVIEDALFRAVTHALGLSYTETGDSHSSFRSSTLDDLPPKATKIPTDKFPENMNVRLKKILSHPTWVRLPMLSASIRWVSNMRTHPERLPRGCLILHEVRSRPKPTMCILS